MSEVRLIDVNAAISAFADMGQDIDTHDVIDLLKEQPTVDAVPVVRCKDCQWFDANDDYYDSYCDKNGISVEEDFFCADGERR